VNLGRIHSLQTPQNKKQKKNIPPQKNRGMAAHLRQELLSEYHDVWTSGLTFYEHPMTIQPESHVLWKKPVGRVSE